MKLKATPPWSWSLNASVSRLWDWCTTVFLFLCKEYVALGWKTLRKMRIYLMARSKKPNQAPRELQYIAKISHGIKLSLKFWANIFRQKIHTHFRQKCVSPLSFQTVVSIKDSHGPLAGPCSQQLSEGLKSTTVSPALLPHTEEDRARTLLWSPSPPHLLHSNMAGRILMQAKKGFLTMASWPSNHRSNPIGSLKTIKQENYFHAFRKNYGCAAGKLLRRLVHVAQYMPSHPPLLVWKHPCRQNAKKFSYSLTHWF